MSYHGDMKRIWRDIYYPHEAGFSNIITKYHAKDAEIMITLNNVRINMGYANPSPCIILVLVIPIVIKGYANAMILKYKTDSRIISGELVKAGRMLSLKNKKNTLKLNEMAIARVNPYFIIFRIKSNRLAP